MQRLILRWLINAVALWVAVTYVPGIDVQGGWPAILVAALIFGLVNALVRPVIELLTCPLIIVTLGLGTLLINALMFWLTSVISSAAGFGFTVDGFWAAFLGALAVSVISAVLTLLLKDELKGRRRRPNK